MPIGDIYRFARTVELDGQTCVNVLHFEDTTGTEAFPESALIDSWDVATGTYAPEREFALIQRGFTSKGTVSYECAKIWPVPGDPVVDNSTVTPQTALDNGLPTFAQIKVSNVTDLLTRSGRGGFYISGIAESQTNGNLIDGALQTSLVALATALLEVYAPGGSQYVGFALGVWSRLLEDFNQTSQLNVGNTLGTMVSRRAGRGT